MAHPHNITLDHDSPSDTDKNSSNNPNSTTNTNTKDTEAGHNPQNVTTHLASSTEPTPVGLPQVHSANSSQKASEHPRNQQAPKVTASNPIIETPTNPQNVTTHPTPSIEPTPVGLPQVHSANSSEHPQVQKPSGQSTGSTDTGVSTNPQNVTTHPTSSIEPTPVGLPQVHSKGTEHPQGHESHEDTTSNTDSQSSTNPQNVTTHPTSLIEPTPVGLPQVHSKGSEHPQGPNNNHKDTGSNADTGNSTNPQNVTTHLPSSTNTTSVGLSHTPSTSRSDSGPTMGDLPATNGHGPQGDTNGSSTNFTVKAGLAKMLKGGVIMDVVNSEQARIAEEAGACAVMALERVPADIRAQGGVARMSDPKMIKEIMETVTIPVMAKARIGHFVECQILEALGVDYIDESEVLTPADQVHHVEKHPFKVPFVCGCRNLGEALRRISEGAAMIRTKGEAGTGDVVEAVEHMRTVTSEINAAANMSDMELRVLAKEIGAPFDLLKETAQLKRLPVVNFAAGGVATPADAALMMQLGCDGVFVGSGIFKSGDAKKRAKAIVQAVTHFRDPKVLAEVSSDLGEAMVGLNVGKMGEEDRMAKRGW